jgi:hypothetical protein
VFKFGLSTVGKLTTPTLLTPQVKPLPRVDVDAAALSTALGMSTKPYPNENRRTLSLTQSLSIISASKMCKMNANKMATDEFQTAFSDGLRISIVESFMIPFAEDCDCAARLHTASPPLMNRNDHRHGC